MKVAFRYNDDRLMSRIIAWFQRSDASHCEIARGPYGKTYVCLSSSMLDGGVRAKEIDLVPEKWRIYDVGGDDLIASEWFSQHADDGYDWLWLLGFIWRPIRGRERRWGCSEACAAMLGLHEPWRYDVADLEALCRLIGRRVQ